MSYIQCNHCGKKFEELNASGIKKVNCVWCNEPLRNNPQKKSQRYIEASIDTNEVVVTDIRMSFGSMLLFQVKWVIASIPAIIIAVIILCLILIAFSFAFGLLGLGIKNLMWVFE